MLWNEGCRVHRLNPTHAMSPQCCKNVGLHGWLVLINFSNVVMHLNFNMLECKLLTCLHNLWKAIFRVTIPFIIVLENSFDCNEFWIFNSKFKMLLCNYRYKCVNLPFTWPIQQRQRFLWPFSSVAVLNFFSISSRKVIASFREMPQWSTHLLSDVIHHYFIFIESWRNHKQ